MALRPGEAYGLQRRDVKLKDDLSGGEINVVRAAKEYREKDPETGKIRKRILVNSTKTEGSQRKVLLPPYICKALDQHLRSFVVDRPDAYLFTGPKRRNLPSTIFVIGPSAIWRPSPSPLRP